MPNERRGVEGLFIRAGDDGETEKRDAVDDGEGGCGTHRGGGEAGEGGGRYSTGLWVPRSLQ